MITTLLWFTMFEPPLSCAQSGGVTCSPDTCQFGWASDTLMPGLCHLPCDVDVCLEKGDIVIILCLNSELYRQFNAIVVISSNEVVGNIHDVEGISFTLVDVQ